MIAFVNNSFIEAAEARLGVGDLSIQRGYAAFDYLRTRKGLPLFLDHYLDRFFRSAQRMHLQPEHSKQEVAEIIRELTRKNGLEESGIRMIMTGGYSPDSYEPVRPNLLILEQELKLPGEEKFRKGINVITQEYVRDLPDVKSINYLMGIWLQQQVKQMNAWDVLYHNNGWVSEFPRANVFIVTKDQKLVTPSENILMGITRMKVLELAREMYSIEERPVNLEELSAASEVFMTSTTKRILPVTAIAGHKIGEGTAGAVTTALYKAFLQLEATLIS